MWRPWEGGEEWTASSLDWLGRKPRRDDEVLVRAQKRQGEVGGADQGYHDPWEAL